MKKNIKLLFLCAVIALTAACSKNEDTQEKNATNALTFVLTEPQFHTDATLTRSMAQPVTERIDLGDGLEAEAVIEPDNANAASPATRAELPNQHYTIYAVKQGVRVPGFTLRGTVSGSGAQKVFTPDNGTQGMSHLEEGHYTFVCYNDAVTMQYNRLVVNRTDAQRALIGVAKNVHITGKEHKVTFEMKHQAVRMRFELTTYWEIANLTSRASIQAPTSISYDIAGENRQVVSTGVQQNNISFANNATPDAKGKYVSGTDYVYMLPEALGKTTVLQFLSGALYQKNVSSLSNKLVSTFPNTRLNANESYNVKLTLYYKFNYLFSDGTTGTLVWGNSNNKTAIAAVVRDATAGSPFSGMAMALNSANNNGSAAWAVDLRAPYNQDAHYDFSYVYNDMNGEGNTYNVVNNAVESNFVKATSDKTPAFKAAANYTPGVATESTIGRWYLPAMGEMKTAMAAMAGMNPASLTNFGLADLPRFALFRVILIQAGGNYHTVFWTSNEIGSMGGAVDISSGKAYFGGNSKNINYYYRARPFTHFSKKN